MCILTNLSSQNNDFVAQSPSCTLDVPTFHNQSPFICFQSELLVRHISQDTVAIKPSHFGAPVEDALTAEINKKYANRVLHDIGLCIAVFDISQAGEGKVRYGDGFLWYTGWFTIFASGSLISNT